MDINDKGLYDHLLKETEKAVNISEVLTAHQEKYAPKPPFLHRLKGWYNTRSKKQRIIVWAWCIAFSAAGPPGWVFIAPWLMPLISYLEYKRPQQQ